VSAWRSGPPVIETLGEDEPPPSRARWVTAGLVVVGLVAAFAAGVESRGVSVGGLTLGSDRVALAGGTLRAAGPSLVGVALVLPLHNAGDTPVDVSVAAVPGLVIHGAPTTRVPPGRWVDVPLTVAADCAGPATTPASATVRTGDAQQVDVALAEQDGLVGDLRAATCTEQRDLTAARLAGVWVVDRVFGRWTALAGQHVLVFRRDGSFIADPEGVRFTRHRGVVGRFRLRGPLLDAVEQGFVGYACLPGERALWRAGQLPDGRVVVRFVRGRNCPDQPHETWLLRRLSHAVPGP
jgi:hypothetical protein